MAQGSISDRWSTRSPSPEHPRVSPSAVASSYVDEAALEGLMLPGDLPDLVGPRPAWMRRAACKGEDVSAFVPAQPLRGDSVPDRLAEVCARCPVVIECLEFALERPELLGCWAGPPTPSEGL